MHTSRHEHDQECLYLEREEYTAMDTSGPGDPYLSVLGRLPSSAGGSAVPLRASGARRTEHHCAL